MLRSYGGDPADQDVGHYEVDRWVLICVLLVLLNNIVVIAILGTGNVCQTLWRGRPLCHTTVSVGEGKGRQRDYERTDGEQSKNTFHFCVFPLSATGLKDF
jgi:hypothetical protein